METLDEGFTYFLDCGGGGVGSALLHTIGGKCLGNIDNGPLQKVIFERNEDALCIPMDVMEATLENTNAALEAAGRPRIEKGATDIYVASTSCKELSIVNKQRSWFAPSNLNLLDLPRRIAQFMPKTVICENSDNLFKPNMRPLFNMFLHELDKLQDYNYEFAVLDCYDYSIGQKRKRGFTLLTRKDYGYPAWPEPTAVGPNLNALFPEIIGFSSGQYRTEPSPADRPCCTVTATGSITVFANQVKRKLTIEEGKRLMTVPMAFNLEGLTYREAFEILGNGIPSKMLLAIVQTIKDKVLSRGSSGLCTGLAA